MLDLVATCGLGLEEILAAELRDLGAEPVLDRGAVRWSGSWPDVWRANLRLRTANRVLVTLASWHGPDGDALVEGARRVVERDTEWDGVAADRLFRPERTLSVRATVALSHVTDARWAALKVKDGVVDGQRERFGRRADVARGEADLALRLWLSRDRATLLLDTSGEPLDHRGYRPTGVTAPLREQLAAAVVLAAGWDGRGPIVDPMCGSATLLVEAAWIALGRAPGALRASREGWPFERLPGFDAAVWRAIRSEPVPPLAPDPEALRLVGVDRDPRAIGAARESIAAAGLADRVELVEGDAFGWTPPAGPGLVVSNPPYGERVDRQADLWPKIGDLLKQRYAGYRAALLAGGEANWKGLGLKPKRRLPVRNGPLEARIVVLELYAGSRSGSGRSGDDVRG